MAFWQFTGSVAEFFPGYKLTAKPGYVYDLGADGPPPDPLPKEGQAYPAPPVKWVTSAGPATDGFVQQVSDVAAVAGTTNASLLTSGTLAYARVPIGAAASTVAAGDDARILAATARAGGTTATASKVPFFNVLDYGATGDGTTDDTAAVQAAIAAARATMPGSGYATSFMAVADVFLPPGVYSVSGLNLPGRVHLRGSGARLKAKAAGPILTMSGEASIVSQIMFDGNGVALGSNGIICDSTCLRARIADVKFQDFAGRAILQQASSNVDIHDVFAENCLLANASLSTYTGVVEIQGNDSTLRNSEISGARTVALGGFSPSGFVAAVAYTGSTSGNHWCGPGVQAESGDIGVYVNTPSTASIKMLGVRADINMGHGFVVDGGVGTFTQCHAYRNGLATANTYNGFQVTGTVGSNFIFTGCVAEHNGSGMLVGFSDLQNSDAFKNWYLDCRSIGASLKGFNNTSVGARITLPSGPYWLSAGTGTTWNVDQRVDIKASNTGSVTVTALNNGFQGQKLTLYGDGFTTIQNNGTISNIGGGDLLLVNNVTYSYIRQNSIWLQTGTSAATAASGIFATEVSALDLKVTGLTGAVNPGRFAGVTASGVPTSGTFAVADYVLTQNGQMFVCVTAGTPGVWVSPRDVTNLVASGEETMPRGSVAFAQAGFAVGMGSQDMRGAQFVARKTETITQVKVFTNSTAAAATPTLCRIGVYSVASNGDHTLVASTANDTTLFAATNTSYTRTFSVSFTKTAGVRYMVGVLIVSAAALPTMLGLPANAEYSIAPAMATRITAQSDLPSSFALAATTGSCSPIYAVLLP